MDPNVQQVPQQQIQPQESVPTPVQNNIPTPENNKSNKNLLIIVVIGFIILIIIMIAGFWYLNSRQNLSNENVNNLTNEVNVTPATEEEDIQDTEGLQDAVNELGQEDQGLETEVNQLEQDANF